MSIAIGAATACNRVFLAPMSGVTDEPFRALADDLGAGLVVTEMVACEQLIRERRDMVRRASRPAMRGPFVIQLAGNEARWMEEGARVAAGRGAEVIDINMGCPAREVAGKLSGSALMRDLDHAERLIAATIAGAGGVPVTVKMRLGWDHGSLNAPELARRAQRAGVAMVTVHGRTRCQFYKGRADWAAIRAVKDAVRVPVIANGDGRTAADVRAMLAASGADGVMVGRGAYGAPWAPAELAGALDPGAGRPAPSPEAQVEIAVAHIEAMLSFYGFDLGLRNARKHMGWYLDRRHAGDTGWTARHATERRALLTATASAEALTRFRRLLQSGEPQRIAA